MGKKHKNGARVPVVSTYNQSKKLFCYGALNVHDVQRQVWGESMQGKTAVLTNYELKLWPDSDILYVERKPGEQVVGKFYELTQEQLKRTDEYETDAYERVRVEVSDKEWVETYVISSKGDSL